MKVEYVFSKRNKWGSKLIAWGSSYENLDLEHIPSHVGVLLNNSIVVESTFFSGVRVVPYSEWLKINQELYKLPCAQEYRSSKDTLDRAFSLWSKGYDWAGIMYFGWSLLKLILLDKPLPAKNKWQKNNRYFCTEFVAMLVDEDFSMSTPAKICDAWLKEMSSGKQD
jgi:hypothetical protein